MKNSRRVALTLTAVIACLLIAATRAGTCDDPTPARTICATNADCDAKTVCQSVGCRGGMCTAIDRAPSGTPCESGGTCNSGLCCW